MHVLPSAVVVDQEEGVDQGKEEEVVLMDLECWELQHREEA